jgi:hypothetical protein
MQRVLFIAALVIGLVPGAWAQHGGGHGGGGGGGHAGFSGGGFSGGHVGGFNGGGHAFGGSHSFASPRSFSGARSSGFSGRSFSRGSTFARGPYRGYGRGFNHSGVGVRIRSYPYWGWGYGYPYYGYGYPYLWGGIDPYWWWEGDSSDSGYDPGYAYDPGYIYDPAYGNGPVDPGPQYQTGLNNEMKEQGIAPWRSQQDRDTYARSNPPQTERSDAMAATVLVFRDQHKEEVQNYAIVGQTLWNFSPQHTQRIPLSDLDIPATEKANDERGVSFHVPGTGEGQ